MESGDSLAVTRKLIKAKRKCPVKSTLEPTSSNSALNKTQQEEVMKPKATISNTNHASWNDFKSRASGTPLPPSTADTDTEENVSDADADFDGNFSSIRKESSEYVKSLPAFCSTAVSSNASFTEIYSASTKYFENHFPGPKIPETTSNPEKIENNVVNSRKVKYLEHIAEDSKILERPSTSSTDSNYSERPSTSSTVSNKPPNASSTEIPEGISKSSEVVEILFSKPEEPNARRIEDKVDLALLQSVYRDSEFQQLRSDILATAASAQEDPPVTPSSSVASIPEVGQRNWYQRTGRRALLERFSLKNMELIDPKTMSKVRSDDSSLNFYEITSNDMKQLRQAEIWANLKAFVNTPVAIGFELNCEIVRDRRGLGLFPHFFLNLEVGGTKVVVLTARRRKKSLRSNFLISTDPSELKRYGAAHVGTLRSNWFRKQFTVFDGRPKREVKDYVGFNGMVSFREQMGSVVYEDDREWFAGAGSIGPYRMRVFLPAIINECRRLEIRPSASNETLQKQGKKHENNGILELKNKIPLWDEEAKAFTLQFEGRVACQPSLVNFQLVHEEDENELICQFGQVDKDTFSLDFRYPLCPLQAFALALSSLSTSKLTIHNEKVVCKYPAGVVS